MTQPDDALTTSQEVRQRHAGRTEVLDKVKALMLLADDMHATLPLVANYFGVSEKTIESVVLDHRQELEANGLRVLRGADLREFATSFEEGTNPVGPKTRSLAVFNRRAILNIAMLLRDSAVARDVRAMLLDAAERLPDLATADGQIELLSRMLDVARRNKALETANAVQAKELESARPRAEYVDRFVNATDDVFTVNTVAGQFGVSEPVFRAYLVDRKVIYRRHLGNRWSRKKKRLVPEYEWLARAQYRSWFTPKDQPEAPRLHNGQMRTTLYFNAVGKERVQQLVQRHPIGSPKPLDDEAA